MCEVEKGAGDEGDVGGRSGDNYPSASRLCRYRSDYERSLGEGRGGGGGEVVINGTVRCP